MFAQEMYQVLTVNEVQDMQKQGQKQGGMRMQSQSTEKEKMEMFKCASPSNPNDARRLLQTHPSARPRRDFLEEEQFRILFQAPAHPPAAMRPAHHATLRGPRALCPAVGAVVLASAAVWRGSSRSDISRFPEGSASTGRLMPRLRAQDDEEALGRMNVKSFEELMHYADVTGEPRLAVRTPPAPSLRSEPYCGRIKKVLIHR